MAATVDTGDENTRYCFLVDWHDAHADLVRSYQLFYFPAESSVEMYDVKQRRTFLKRTKINVRLQDLYVGAVVNVNARQLVLRGYGDEFTKEALENQMQRTLIIIKPSALQHAGEILDMIQQRGFTMCRLRMLEFNPQQAENILKGDAGVGGGRSLAVEWMKAGAISELASLAQSEALKSGVYVPSDPRQAMHSIFDEPSYGRYARTAKFENSTLALIRPHALGLTGQIVNEILRAGFEISDMELFRLERANAEEFLEVYQGVVPEYQSMIQQLIAGSVVAMEITGRAEIVKEFRVFCGPMDPELARILRPQSLRAKFGVDTVHNAIHCTDLAEDGPLEVQYFFKILVS